MIKCHMRDSVILYLYKYSEHNLSEMDFIDIFP